MIKPYYEEPNITIYNGDCLEVMKELPDKSVDLVLTDPPYGVNLKYDEYVDTEENWYELFNHLIPEAKRIARMTILPSCRIRALEYIYSILKMDKEIQKHIDNFYRKCERKERKSNGTNNK